MKRALLLNSDYTPLHFITDFDAIILIYKGKAEVILGVDGKPSLWEDVFSSPTTSIQVPATMRLHKKITKNWRLPRFHKKVLFNRDNWSCQYCGTKLCKDLITIDHLVPTSRGGVTSWNNCVTACKYCNRKKANKTPDEANMSLMSKPIVPTSLHFWDLIKSNVWHPDWDIWISQDKYHNSP